MIHVQKVKVVIRKVFILRKRQRYINIATTMTIQKNNAKCSSRKTINVLDYLGKK